VSADNAPIGRLAGTHSSQAPFPGLAGRDARCSYRGVPVTGRAARPRLAGRTTVGRRLSGRRAGRSAAAQRDAHHGVVQEGQEQHDHEDGQREWLPAVRHRRRHTGPGPSPTAALQSGMTSLTCELYPTASAAGPPQPRGASPARPGPSPPDGPGRWRPGPVKRDLGLADAAGTPYRPGPANDHAQGERGEPGQAR